MSDFLQRYRREIDLSLKAYIKEYFAAGLLRKSVLYALFPGGKRLRPILTLISGEGLGLSRKKLMPLAGALEMIHNYTLIHDDLPAMDNDDYRRGRLTVHKKFGQAIGILAGDALLTQSFEVAALSGSAQAMSYLAYASGARGVVQGQVLDLGLGRPNKKFQDFLDLYELKTSRLFEAAMVMPAFLCSGTKKVAPKDFKTLSFFGRLWGECFQLADDLEDVATSRKDKPLTLLDFWGESRLREVLAKKAVLLKSRIGFLPLRATSRDQLTQIFQILFSSFV